MQNIRIRYNCWALALSFVCQLFCWGSPAEASLRYSFTEEVTEDANGDFTQANTHRFFVSSQQEITEKLKTNESINYSMGRKESKDTLEAVSSTLGMSLFNEIFSMDVNGQARQTVGDGRSSDVDSDRLEVNWRSQWKKSIVAPQVSLSLANGNIYNSSTPRLTDKNNLLLSSSVNWDLELASLRIDYMVREAKNNINLREEFQETLSAMIKGGQDFLDRRLRVSYSHLYSEHHAEQRVAAGSGNTALVNLIVPELRTGIDSPLDLIELPAASANLQMLDGDLLTPAYSIPQNTIDHTFLVVTNGQQVDVIYLYAIDNWGGGVPATLTNWRLYSTDLLGSPWTVEALNSATDITYDAVNQRLEIQIPSVQRNYLKLVVDRTAIALPPIDITEGEFYDAIAAPTGSTVIASSDNLSNTTLFGIFYKVNDLANLKYNVGLNSIMGGSLLDADSLSHTVNFDLKSRDNSFKLTMSYYSGLKKQPILNYETKSSTYSLDLQKQLLSTLQFSLQASRQDTIFNGLRLAERDSYGFYCDVQVYPDLNARIEALYSINTGAGSKNETQTSTLNVASRVNPDMVVSLVGKYDVRRGSSENKTLSSSLAWSWSLSKLLSTRFSAQHIDSDQQEKTLRANYGFSLQTTKRMNLNMSYSVVKNLDITHSGNATWSWAALRNLSLRAVALFSKTEGVDGNELRLSGTLSYSFGLGR